MMRRMKKLLLVITIILIVGGGAFLYLKNNKDDEAMPLSSPSSSGNTVNTPAPSSAAVSYKDGTYTGDTIQADRGYGPIQVKAVISGGKITDIIFLQMPDSLGHSQEVTA